MISLPIFAVVFLSQQLHHVRSFDIGAVKVVRSGTDGDMFEWEGDCAPFNAMVSPAGGECFCKLEMIDGTKLVGTFYRSFNDVYACYYDSGQMAGASLVASGNPDSDEEKVAVIPSRTRNSKGILITKQWKVFLAETLRMTDVEAIAYTSSGSPYTSVITPFHLQRVSNYENNSNAWKLKNSGSGASANINYHNGDLLRIHLEAYKGSITTSYLMFVKIPGEKVYDFGGVASQYPLSEGNVSTERDLFFKATVGLGVVCGIILLTLLTLLLIYCCRNRCCFQKKDVGRTRENMVDVRGANTDIGFIPPPRRDKSPLPPRPPERLYEGLNSLSPNGIIVSQPLYETTGGEGYYELESSNPEDLYVDPNNPDELYQPGLETTETEGHNLAFENEGYYDGSLENPVDNKMSANDENALNLDEGHSADITDNSNSIDNAKNNIINVDVHNEEKEVRVRIDEDEGGGKDKVEDEEYLYASDSYFQPIE